MQLNNKVDKKIICKICYMSFIILSKKQPATIFSATNCQFVVCYQGESEKKMTIINYLQQISAFTIVHCNCGIITLIIPFFICKYTLALH